MEGICYESCCRGKSSPWRVKLISADGLESVKTILTERTAPIYETVVAEPYRHTDANWSPSSPIGPTFRTRRYELVDRDPGPRTLTYREKLDPPPKPQPEPTFVVCERACGLWCSTCSTNHQSVAPRVVRNPKLSK